MVGLRALVVEAEYLIAAEIEQTLRDAGAEEVTLVRSASEALGLAASGERFDVAILEASFGSPVAVALSNSLRAAGVAVVVTSADHAVQSLFAGSVPLGKPFDAEALLLACKAACGANLTQPSPAT